MSVYEKAVKSFHDQDWPRAINYLTVVIAQEKHPRLRHHSLRARATMAATPIEKVQPKTWHKIKADCDRALELDGNNIDAMYVSALYVVHCERDLHRGLGQLLEVYTLSLKSNDKKYVLPREIHAVIVAVKHELSQRRFEDALLRSNNLLSSCVRLLQDDYHQSIDALAALRLDKKTHEYALAKAAAHHAQQTRDLTRVFANNYNHALAHSSADPPDYLCDPISFNVFEDPVLTPSGRSYERAWLFDYLDKDPRDPLTREKLTKEQCYPNLSLKKCVEDYHESTTFMSTCGARCDAHVTARSGNTNT